MRSSRPDLAGHLDVLGIRRPRHCGGATHDFRNSRATPRSHRRRARKRLATFTDRRRRVPPARQRSNDADPEESTRRQSV